MNKVSDYMAVEGDSSESQETFLAGIDYGRVRIGIALAHRQLRIPLPCENYTRRGDTLDSQFFRDFASTEKVSRFVVGLPLHLDGGESVMAAEARQFGQWLHELTGVPVVYFDERFSSVEAEGMLRERKLTRKKRKQRIDMLAAQVMLAAYLESGEREYSPAPLEDHDRR
ncbi:MAG: Holliday junction resolvase RuvX [Planctomycetales bacterium]|nr:Holliday junction resolvase RuvX [Planctomycetales bacterium]